MKRRTAALALIPLAVIAWSATKPNIVGRWTGSLTMKGTTIPFDLTFGADGKLAFKQTVGAMTSTQKGPYSVTKNTIVFTVLSMESPKLDKATLDKANAQLAKSKTKVTFDLVWKDDNNITLTQQGSGVPGFSLKRTKT